MIMNMPPSASAMQTSSPTLPKQLLKRTGSFRSSSPNHSIRIEHPMPNHPHLHIHTIRSPVTNDSNDNTDESAIYDDDISPPTSISAQILAPILNAPVPSSLKSHSPSQQVSHPSTDRHSRGATARANALGAISRSSSAKPRNRRPSNEDNSLASEYLELIGDGKVDSERLEKIRRLAAERGIPGHLRKVLRSL
jgi:hypothetical protein